MTAAIEGAPTVEREDVYRVVLDLTLGSRYLASVLYDRYAYRCHESGRQPGSRNGLGRMLRSVGCEPCKLGSRNKASAAWLITGEAVMNSKMGLRA